jgi:hypothetical protein
VEVQGELTKGQNTFYKWYSKKYPDKYNEIDPYFEYQMWIGDKLQKCPFNGKPPLHKVIRKKYKLKCLQCGSPFSCPGDTYRHGHDRKPLCGECLANCYESEYQDYYEVD